MTQREQLANRRGADARELEHSGTRHRLQVGFYADGRPGEIFLDGCKPDSALDALAADGAILVSLLLQYGVPLDVIGHALRRTPSGEPASVIGAAIDALAADIGP